MINAKDLDSLLSELKTIHADLKPISPEMVVVAEWVRWKCRYGCRAYGKHLCCPPFTPAPEETGRMLSEYRHAVLARFEAKPDQKLLPKHPHHALWNSITRLHKTITDLESAAFLAGYYKAFGMVAMPCTLCETCVMEEMQKKDQAVFELDTVKCRHKDLMRPSLEACGIDVFRTLQNAGYSPKVLKDYMARVELFGIVLLD